MIKFLDLQKQYHMIKSQVQESISEVLESGEFVGGKYVRAFEENFALELGVPHVLGVANGTDAIEIALRSLELRGNEVILPANTFFGSLEGIVHAGLKPVMVDCGEDYCIDPLRIQEAITPQSAAILVVHLYGRACKMEEILQIARKYSLKIIEDCAQSFGAKVKIHGREHSVGSIGDIGCFSFYPGKNLGAYGDGGAISTQSQELYERCMSLANHGRGRARYCHDYIGRNSRLDGIQSAILNTKLAYIHQWNAHRRQVAQWYQEFLQDCPLVVLPPQYQEEEHVFHLYVIRVKQRDAVMEAMRARGIEVGIHYPIALPSLEACKDQKAQMLCPLAMQFAQEILSLPMGEHLSKEDVRLISQTLKEILEQLTQNLPHARG